VTGNYDSIAGMEKSEPINQFVNGHTVGSLCAGRGSCDATVCGVSVETDDGAGLAVRAAAVRLGPYLEEQKPQFWG
jgi:calcineurin-like phosphoesterase